jgi:hypothetical protein
MKEVSNVESISKFNIAFNVKNKKVTVIKIIDNKINDVCGLLSKLKNGPMIVNIKPKVEEMKNLGNRKILSQKSDIGID